MLNVWERDMDAVQKDGGWSFKPLPAGYIDIQIRQLSWDVKDGDKSAAAINDIGTHRCSQKDLEGFWINAENQDDLSNVIPESYQKDQICLDDPSMLNFYGSTEGSFGQLIRIEVAHCQTQANGGSSSYCKTGDEIKNYLLDKELRFTMANNQ